MVRFVDSAGELTSITATFDRCRDQGSEIVVVSGATASGKSRLIREVGSVVAESGGLVLSASGAWVERRVQLGLIRQLLQSGDVPFDFGTCDAGPGPDIEAQAAEQICSALLDRIGERPALLAIDDVHHGDRMSRGVLLHLQRRLPNRHVLVLLGAGDSTWTRIPTFDAELHRYLPCRRFRLGPFSRDAVADLLELPVDSPRVATHLDASGGNPLLLTALIADASDSGAELSPDGQSRSAEPGPDVVADTLFKAAVSACVHRCDETIAVVRGLAVLDRTSSHSLLPALVDLDGREIDKQVSELIRTGLLRPDGGFRHPAARAAVVEATPSAERAALHGRAAELLYRQGAEAATVAAHLILAGEHGTGWSASVLLGAADEALRSGRSELAVAYADFARRTELEPQARVSALVTLVEAKQRTAPAAVVSHLPELQAALDGGELADRGVGALLSSLLWTGRFDQVLAITGKPGEPAAGAQAALTWMQFLNPALLAGPGAERRAEGPGHDVGMRSLAALICAVRQEQVGQVAASADSVLQNCERADPPVETVLAALLALILVNELDRAEAWCGRLAADFADRGQNTMIAVISAVNADVALRQGDAQAAATRARTALALMSRASWGIAAGYPLGTLIAAEVQQGRLDEAEHLLRQPLPPDLEASTFGLPYLYARGRHALAGGRPYAALEDFRRCGRVMRDWGVDLSTLAPWRIGMAEAYAELGRAEEARTTLDEQVRRATGRTAYVGAIALRILGRLSAADQRLPVLQKAVAILEGSGHRRELALALSQLSNEHYARGDSKRSRTMARRAMEVARGCACDGEIRELLLGGERFDVAGLLGENDEQHPELTDAEGRVARLAAGGLTNRQIGQRLYLSTSTVEQHLTKIFRKLGISRRTDLIGMLWADPVDSVAELRAS